MQIQGGDPTLGVLPGGVVGVRGAEVKANKGVSLTHCVNNFLFSGDKSDTLFKCAKRQSRSRLQVRPLIR
jgi:hypothetical protein